jgi:hypothetical protein
MIKWLAARLSYANVMATLAVFVVLGGAAAATLRGNGSVKFGAEKGLDKASYETVLNLSGLGKVQAICGGQTGIRFINRSGKEVQATLEQGSDEIFFGATMADGENFEGGAATQDNGIDTLRFHVFTADADGKPMADITVSHKYPGDSNCAGRTVAAQAVASG